jgi:hypothetical protein
MAGTSYLKVEFVRGRCANAECKVETDWWIIGGVLSQTVCPMCYVLIHTICNDPYWQQLQADFLTEQAEEKRRIDRLKPGGEYFPGDGLE